MRFVGGDLQGEFMARVRGVDRRRCLAVPVDLGKWSAIALVTTKNESPPVLTSFPSFSDHACRSKR